MIDEMPRPHSGRHLPSLTFKQEDIPGLKDWKVNSKHYLIIKVELVAKHNTKAMGINDLEDREKVEGTLQVLNVKPLGNEPVDAKTLEEKDFRKTVADVRSGKK